MPYCEQCNASCEVKDVEATPSAHMQQGTCTRCNHRVFFFTDIPLEAASSAEASRPALATPRKAPVSPQASTPRKPASEEQSALDDYAPPQDLRLLLASWMTPTVRYLALGAGVIVLLLIIFSVIQRALAPAEPMSAGAQFDAATASITVTNNNSYAWSNVNVTLDGGYISSQNTRNFPSHGTIHFMFSNFLDWAGHAFNPAKGKPGQVKIVAKDEKGRTLNSVVQVK